MASNGDYVYTGFPRCSCGEMLLEMAGTGELFPLAAALCSSPAQVDPYLPYEYTCEGMLERIHAYIQHQVRHHPCSAGEGTPSPCRLPGGTPGAGRRRFVTHQRCSGAAGGRLGVRGRGRGRTSLLQSLRQHWERKGWLPPSSPQQEIPSMRAGQESSTSGAMPAARASCRAPIPTTPPFPFGH